VTRVFTVDPARPEPDVIDQAADAICAGLLVAFPTETVYGLGADATSAGAVARIFEAKGRPATNPLIVHGDRIEMIRSVVDSWPDSASVLANAFWPGPLTLILPKSRLIPEIVTAGNESVGVRIPDSIVARELIRSAGRPVAAPSANRSNAVSPTTASHVLADLSGRVEILLDAGPTRIGIESTVLDLTTSPPRILRPGGVTASRIEQILGKPIEVPAPRPVDSTQPQTSPGQLEVHYAPRTPVTIFDPFGPDRSIHADPERCGLVVVGPTSGPVDRRYGKRVEWKDPNLAAQELYATLRSWDDGSLDAIEVILPPADDAWRAVRDRLWRASRRGTGES
jgi:L-threonylcarbamoyladenylate synthase